MATVYISKRHLFFTAITKSGKAMWDRGSINYPLKARNYYSISIWLESVLFTTLKNILSSFTSNSVNFNYCHPNYLTSGLAAIYLIKCWIRTCVLGGPNSHGGTTHILEYRHWLSVLHLKLQLQRKAVSYLVPLCKLGM